jgi:hypothetical protein
VPQHLAVEHAHHVLAPARAVQARVGEPLLERLDLLHHDAVLLRFRLALADRLDERVELAERRDDVRLGQLGQLVDEEGRHGCVD